jgi:hypothetical protein
MEVGGQLHAPAALPPGKRPGTHCTGGWVGPRAGLDGCGKCRPHRDFFCPVFPFDPFRTFKSFCPSRSILLSLQQTQQTDIHALGWIRTRNPSNRAAADPRLRPRGH